MPEQTGPPDPITELAQLAASLHEAFTAYIEARFTSREALHLVTAILTAGIDPGTPPDEDDT